MWIYHDSHDTPWLFVQAALLVLCGSVPFLDAQPSDVRYWYGRVGIWVIAAVASFAYIYLKILQAPRVRSYENVVIIIDGIVTIRAYNLCTDW